MRVLLLALVLCASFAAALDSAHIGADPAAAVPSGHDHVVMTPQPVIVAPLCEAVFQGFNACAIPNIRNGTCPINNSTGQFGLCPPCNKYYPAFVSCMCQIMAEPYGSGANCLHECIQWWDCSLFYSQNQSSCLNELDAMAECIQEPTAGATTDRVGPPAALQKPPAAALSSSSPPMPTIQTEFIIPPLPPWPYSHACTITQTASNNLVAIYDAGPGETNSGLGIWFSIKNGNDTSATWSAPKLAAKIPGICAQNPSVYQNAQGKLFLTFHYGGYWWANGTCETDSWQGAYVTSDDGGQTWSNYTLLPVGFLGGIKNKCITLSNGAVLCPSSTQSIIAFSLEFWQSHIETTDQEFSQWSKSNNINFNYANGIMCPIDGNIQPTLFETSPGTVVALLRTGCGVIARSVSTDYGKTFSSPAEPLALPNPDSGIDGVLMLGADDIGMLLLFNNNAQSRNPLSIASSLDGGLTWTLVADVANSLDNEASFQYPAVIQDRFNPRVAHTCFTWSDGGGEQPFRSMAYARIEFPQQ